ncbi:MAG: hypothetical protein IJR80_09015 [Treponema sp.]|nr:hypothetical protein [Treponema sp.]
MECLSSNLLFTTIVGAIIGGCVSFAICWLTIKHDKENVRFERFRMICTEFASCREAIAKNASQPGDEVSTGIAHKSLSPDEVEKILFLLSEIEKIIQQDNSYLEAFYNLNEDDLKNLLHEKKILDKVKLVSDGADIFHLKNNGKNTNKIYSLVQKFFLRLAGLNN